MNQLPLPGMNDTLEQNATNVDRAKFISNASMFLISSWETALSLKQKGDLPQEIVKYLQELESATRMLISSSFLVETTKSLEALRRDIQSGQNQKDSSTPSLTEEYLESGLPMFDEEDDF